MRIGRRTARPRCLRTAADTLSGRGKDVNALSVRLGNSSEAWRRAAGPAASRGLSYLEQPL